MKTAKFLMAGPTGIEPGGTIENNLTTSGQSKDTNGHNPHNEAPRSDSENISSQPTRTIPGHNKTTIKPGSVQHISSTEKPENPDDNCNGDLSEVIEAWPELSPEVRRWILDIVDAAKEGEQ